MFTTPLPIATFVSPLQPENAEPPILLTLSGIVMLVKLVQPRNTEPPILVTPSGITTLVKPLQSWNVSFPMLATSTYVPLLFHLLGSLTSLTSSNPSICLKPVAVIVAFPSAKSKSSSVGSYSCQSVSPAFLYKNLNWLCLWCFLIHSLRCGSGSPRNAVPMSVSLFLSLAVFTLRTEERGSV